jgi:protease-4
MLPQGRVAAPLQLHRLRRLAELVIDDRRVAGIVVELEPLVCGWATCQALRAVLARLVEAGKEVVVHLPYGGAMRDVYVASAATRVMLSPRATLVFPGLAAEVRYLREGLEKVGVAVEPFRRAEFKTALEGLTERAMSEPQREQLTALLGAMDAAVVEAIVTGRRLDGPAVRALFERTCFQGAEAVSAGLADDVAYEDELPRKVVPATEPPSKGAFGRARPPKLVPAGRYLALRDRRLFASVLRRPYIAVVRVHGAISDDAALAQEKGGPITSLRKVAGDARALGCVLFVDSPGGSALTSDLIHRELLRLREKKPVVTCMGDVAASGGYYVAAATERIVAQPLTITGSIGVIAGRLLARDLLDKLGVRTEVVRTAPHADMFSIARDADAEERRILDAQVGAYYDAFVRLVAEGRNRPIEVIEPLARGRVWSGADAEARGLVDRLGGLDAAVDEVRDRVKASVRVRRRLRAKLVHETRGPLPPIPPSAMLEAAAELVPDLVDLVRLVRSGSSVMFYAPGIPRIR